jgi:calcium/calmodulin-dependent protein kinase I
MSYLSQFDHTKIEAEVIPGQDLVVETHWVSDRLLGQRRVKKQKIWRVERMIGKGGYGEVRLEELVEGTEQRAVKRLWTNGETLKKEYQRELEALMEFSKQKYRQAAVFVEFLGWFEDSVSVYLAMEYMPLGDLEQHATPSSGPLVEPEIRAISSQILEGLKIMHLESFVHRDLKPKVIDPRAILIYTRYALISLRMF